MKSNRNWALLVTALAAVGGAAGIAAAQTSSSDSSTDTTTATAPANGHHWQGRRHGHSLLGMTLRATRQLNLTADQKASIKTILSNARAQAKAAYAAGPAVDMAVLGNPGDPNYATALQNAKTLAANRIQTESQLQTQIYDVLTAEQKAELPTVLASLKAQAATRRAAHTGAAGAG